jgi:hypothetical protein
MMAECETGCKPGRRKSAKRVRKGCSRHVMMAECEIGCEPGRGKRAERVQKGCKKGHSWFVVILGVKTKNNEAQEQNSTLSRFFIENI